MSLPWRKVIIGKHQAPSSEHQGNTKNQIANLVQALPGACQGLELGVWSFP